MGGERGAEEGTENERKWEGKERGRRDKGTTESTCTCTVGVIKKFPYRLRSVCVPFCVGFALGNRAVCVGFA